MTVFNIFHFLFWDAFTTFKKLSIFAWIRYLPMRKDTFLLSHSPWSWYIRYISIPSTCPARCEQKLKILVRVGDVRPTQCSPFVNPREGGEGPDTIKTNMKAWIQLVEFWCFHSTSWVSSILPASSSLLMFLFHIAGHCSTCGWISRLQALQLLFLVVNTSKR